MRPDADGAPSVAGRLSDDMRGALFMLASGLLFTITSGAIKELSADLPTMVIGVLRNVVALAFFIPMVWRSGFQLVRTSRYLDHFYRGAFGYISFLAMIYVMPFLTLADVIALSLTTP